VKRYDRIAATLALDISEFFTTSPFCTIIILLSEFLRCGQKIRKFFNIFSGDKKGHAVTSCANWCHSVPLPFLPPFFVVAVSFYPAKNIYIYGSTFQTLIKILKLNPPAVFFLNAIRCTLNANY
jgi:hypothetical protein